MSDTDDVEKLSTNNTDDVEITDNVPDKESPQPQATPASLQQSPQQQQQSLPPMQTQQSLQQSIQPTKRINAINFNRFFN